MTRAASPARAIQGGFSFLEVLLAMSVLLLGAVALLSLFTVGVNHLVERRIDAKLEQVRTEVSTLAQAAVDSRPPGDLPPAIPEKADDAPQSLSIPNYAVRIAFGRSPFGGAGVVARATLYYQGRAVKVLPPFPLVRSTIDPR